MSSASPSINVVVVGFGLAGRAFHCYLIGLVPELNLYGVVSGREETRAQIEALGAQRFSHLNEVLDDDKVDLVVLATPNDLHAPQTMAALAAGKHVVTDKPMALNCGQAEEMVAASRAADRILSVFQNRRWDWDFLTIKKALNDGLVGNLVSLELAWNHPGKPRTWRSEAGHGGGRWRDLGAHMVDQALQLVPHSVERVYAQFVSHVLDNDVEDHAHCLLTFANSVIVHVSASSIARVPKRRWFVVGTEGTLIKRGFDPQENALRSGDIDAACEDPGDQAQIFQAHVDNSQPQSVEVVPGRWRTYYENVAAAILGREELSVTADSVCQVMRILDAAALSAARGEVLAVN